MKRLPSCEECAGACCEGILLPGSLAVDGDWAHVRGFRLRVLGEAPGVRQGVWDLDCRCPQLTPQGRCNIHATRPAVCERYPVGGPACIAAIRARRHDRAAELLKGTGYEP